LKYVDEYRDRETALSYSNEIARITTRSWNIMEVCGGQTHSIVRYGIDEMLPEEIRLIHGPGCPVCVTPLELIDMSLEIAAVPGIIFCSFGDMLRVPGSSSDLLSAKAAGSDVRMVYSPLDAISLARANPGREVVFFAVGFETTAPVTAMAVRTAAAEKLENFSMLVAHVLVPPALEAVLFSPSCRVQGFLAAGHVCTVMGFTEYEPIAEKYSVPIVVTGFEPLDILQGIHMCISQLESGRSEVTNQYSRSVNREGNPAAIALIREVFRTVDRKWRGLGVIPSSGLALAPQYQRFEAAEKFGVSGHSVEEPSDCIAGRVLTGEVRPDSCPQFGRGCTPVHPMGALMVSNEGACSAYYRYRRKGIDSGR
jgi:hydrogenase expression/formation protein HypD